MLVGVHPTGGCAVRVGTGSTTGWLHLHVTKLLNGARIRVANSSKYFRPWVLIPREWLPVVVSAIVRVPASLVLVLLHYDIHSEEDDEDEDAGDGRPSSDGRRLEKHPLPRRQVRPVQVLELTPLTHVPVRTLAVVEYGLPDLDGEAGGAVQTVPGGVGGRAGVRLECNVGPHRGRGRPGLRGRPRGTSLCKPG